jgi:ABC-type dipeptide/oligopeptide/nickel transport system permease component
MPPHATTGLGDVGVMAASQIGVAIPNFWFAILLILLFAVKLQWVNAGGFPGWTEDEGGGLGRRCWPSCCRRSRWRWCRRRSWRASRARRCSR